MLQTEPSVCKEYISFVKDSFFAYVPFHRYSTWLLEVGKTGSAQEIFLSLTYFQLTETFDCSLVKGNQTNTSGNTFPPPSPSSLSALYLSSLTRNFTCQLLWWGMRWSLVLKGFSMPLLRAPYWFSSALAQATDPWGWEGRQETPCSDIDPPWATALFVLLLLWLGAPPCNVVCSTHW